MYKSKLQELCHQRQWSLPQYSTTKEGPNHAPRFTSTVTVNGLSFDTPDPARSSKESQNEAAKLAFEHLNAPPKPPAAEPPIIAPLTAGDFSPAENLIGSFDMGDMLASLEAVQPKLPEEYPSPGEEIVEEVQISEVIHPEVCHAPQLNQSIPIFRDDAPTGEVYHLCKNQLQMYAQKRNLPLPTYSCGREGPPHASRFKCKVTVDGKVFESPDFCSTLKDAEHAVARVALLALSSTGEHESDTGLYKNLLQEFAQKEGYHLPVYDTNGSLGHVPTFTSTVVIAGESFMGQQAKTKKKAEMSAAKVAYTTLKERKRNQTSTSLFSACQGQSAFSLSTSSQLNATSGIPVSISPKAGPVSNVTLLTKREIENGVTEDLKLKNHPIPSDEAETSTLRGKAPAFADTIYAQLRSPTLEDYLSESPSPSESSTPSENGNVITVTDLPIESPGEAVSLLPPMTNLPIGETVSLLPPTTNLTIESPGEAVSLPPPGVVRIYSRAMNVTIPEGSVVAYSDEKWIAITAGGNSN